MIDSNKVDYDPRAPKRADTFTPRELEIEGVDHVMIGVHAAERLPNGDVLLTLRMRAK